MVDVSLRMALRVFIGLLALALMSGLSQNLGSAVTSRAYMLGRRSNLGSWAANKSTRRVKSAVLLLERSALEDNVGFVWSTYRTLSGDDRWRYFLGVR